jgi:hypothetical protein
LLQKVLIHIGAPKVASSSIQAFLGRNAEKLKEQGVYPLDKFLKSAKGDGTSTLGADLELETILGGSSDTHQKISAVVDRYCGAFEAEGKQARGGTIVWSAENLTRLSADRDVLLAAFQDIGRRFDLQVLFYVRRPDLWLESSWKQWLLKVSKESPARWAIETARSGHPNFVGAARAWADVIGRDRFSVKPLDPATLWNHKMLEDFAARLGVTGLDCNIPNENRMLNPTFLRFCHRHADLLFRSPHDMRLFDWAETLSLFAAPGSRILGPEVRHQILTLLDGSTRALLTEFCPLEAPVLIPSWCPANGSAEAPASELDPPELSQAWLAFERLVARSLAQAMRVRGRLRRR